MSPRRTTAPSLRFERTLLREGAALLACADEVGRGALCGPVTIGVVVITAETRSAPQGVRDSKLLSAEQRERLAPRIRRWAPHHAVGHAGADEIDAVGVIAALRLAGRRALAALGVDPDLVLLDGNHDYLSAPAQEALFEGLALDAVQAPGAPAGPWPDVAVPPVRTRIKADLTCAAVAAASILAKTERDAIMRGLAGEHPEYGWAENKGYSAPDHLDALRRLGPTVHHRRSWSLPGVADAAAAGEEGQNPPGPVTPGPDTHGHPGRAPQEVG